MESFGQKDRVVVTTMKGGETVPMEEGENRGGTERDISVQEKKGSDSDSTLRGRRPNISEKRKEGEK